MKKTPRWSKSLSSMLVAGLLSVPLAGCDTGLDEVEGTVEDETASTAFALERAGAVPGTTPVATATTTTATTTSSKTGLDPLIASTRTLERNNPWVVQVASVGGLTCKGTVIHKSWVLTAAHCLTSTGAVVTAVRTDPTTGAVTTITRESDGRPDMGIFRHPSFQNGSLYDIGLVHLAFAFDFDADGRVMTAALPRAPLPVGRPGTIVKNRGPHRRLHADCHRRAELAAAAGKFHIYPAAGSLCQGDSGSGFLGNHPTAA